MEEEKNPNHIFVYGSLRPEFENGRVCTRYLSKAIDLGLATIPGDIYNIGWFPGVLPAGKDYPHRVAGHVFEMPPDLRVKIIAHLDMFEGYNGGPTSLFVRDIVEAKLESTGEAIQCWVYYYNGQPNESQRILSGDFIN